MNPVKISTHTYTHVVITVLKPTLKRAPPHTWNNIFMKFDVCLIVALHHRDL